MSNTHKHEKLSASVAIQKSFPIDTLLVGTENFPNAITLVFMWDSNRSKAAHRLKAPVAEEPGVP